ncbi:MAG: preprotein translocase subunit SecE [Acidobacteriaceae bacterium]|jgi:preprotein translocase subunit SecE
MAKAIAVADNNDDGLSRLKARPRELKEFLQNVRSEMRKVVTPTFAEVKSTTIVVLLAVGLFAAYFFVVDTIFGNAVTHLIQYLTKH